MVVYKSKSTMWIYLNKANDSTTTELQITVLNSYLLDDEKI